MNWLDIAVAKEALVGGREWPIMYCVDVSCCIGVERFGLCLKEPKKKKIKCKCKIIMTTHIPNQNIEARHM